MLISAYATRHAYCPHGFSTVDQRSRWDESGVLDADLDDNIVQLTRYIHAVAGHRPSLATHSLLRHITETQRWYAFTLDETDPAQLAQLTGWAGEANAILLIDGALVDGRGRPLLPGDHGAATGEVPVLPEAAERAAEVRAWLAFQRHAPVPSSLPAVRSSLEVLSPDVEQVGLRVIALVMTSDFAASLLDGQPISPKAMEAAFPRSFAALSPRELELFTSRDRQDARFLLPRIEAAQELLWALSRARLSWPNQPCPFDEVKRIVLAGGEQGFLKGLALRPLPELLNEYECLASLMCAIDEQQNRRAAPIPDTDPVIAAQRLAALSWLMNRGLAWDDAELHDRITGSW